MKPSRVVSVLQGHGWLCAVEVRMMKVGRLRHGALDYFERLVVRGKNWIDCRQGAVFSGGSHVKEVPLFLKDIR